MTEQRFRRCQRLTSRREFLTVRDRGRRVSSTSFTLQGIPNDLGHARLGITVTRRIGSAVTRNRVKRILREIFRGHRGARETSLDVVVVARGGIEQRSLVEIEHEFGRRFRELIRRYES